MELYASIKFDREINPDKDYISIGGFEMEFNEDTIVQFDFMESYGNVDIDDPTVLHMSLCDLDVGSFPEAEALKTTFGKVTTIKEFYIYTDEIITSKETVKLAGTIGPVETALNPVELLYLNIINDKGEYITADKNVLGKIWET